MPFENATPRPWTLVEVRTSSGLAYKIGSDEMLDAGKGCCIIYDDYPPSGVSPRRANAELIVTAVNAHSKLVLALARLELANDALAHIRSQATYEKMLSDANGCASDALAELDRARAAARAALKFARAET